MFNILPELEIGSVLEVKGHSVRVELSGDLSELSRTYGGHVYSVGQVASIIKIHHGRQILLARVRMLRMRSEIEDKEVQDSPSPGDDSRVLEADLFGQGEWLEKQERFDFRRGIKTYPLPGQRAYLATRTELREIYTGAQRSHETESQSPLPLLDFGHYFGVEAARCRLDIDRLFGHHCALVGATGSGKSATVAALLHSLLDYTSDGKQLRPRVIVIDPHGEYGEAFHQRATVYHAYDMLPGTEEIEVQRLQLPYWLMSGEEFRDLVIGKTEREATRENNIVRKALRHARLVEKGWIEESKDWVDEDPDKPDNTSHPADPRPTDASYTSLIEGYNRDTPDPFSLDEFERHITLEQGIEVKGRGSDKSWQKKSTSKFESHQKVLDKLKVLRNDPRLRFMMENYDGSLDESELSDIILQFVGQSGHDSDRGDADIRILDLSGLPNEVAGPLTATVARLLFQYKIWQTRSQRELDPILFVCEEAHRYVPNKGEAEYKAAQSAIRRLAKEGRKYGIGLMLVSQRPGDVEETVLSQCNSWVVLRLSNPTDQNFVKSFLPDSFAGLTGLLPVLGRREALVLGSAAAMPARVTIRKLDREQLPDSHDVSFVQGWSSPPISRDEIETVVRRWRTGVASRSEYPESTTDPSEDDGSRDIASTATEASTETD